MIERDHPDWWMIESAIDSMDAEYFIVILGRRQDANLFADHEALVIEFDEHRGLTLYQNTNRVGPSPNSWRSKSADDVFTPSNITAKNVQEIIQAYDDELGFDRFSSLFPSI